MTNKKEIQNELIKEQSELGKKLGRLIEFIDSDKYRVLPDGAKSLLRSQKFIMESYIDILNDRIELLDKQMSDSDDECIECEDIDIAVTDLVYDFTLGIKNSGMPVEDIPKVICTVAYGFSKLTTNNDDISILMEAVLQATANKGE